VEELTLVSADSLVVGYDVKTLDARM